MGAALLRIGTLLFIGDLLYLVIGEAYWGGADDQLFRLGLWASGVVMAGGGLAWVAGRASAARAGRSCVRCGRRVTRGRVYCDDHFVETIHKFRDQQRRKGG
jgi:hypothetical protein